MNFSCVFGFLGLAQYSGDPRIEWHLNAYSTKDAVIDAVRNLPYKGGNTLTGELPSYDLLPSYYYRIAPVLIFLFLGSFSLFNRFVLLRFHPCTHYFLLFPCLQDSL